DLAPEEARAVVEEATEEFPTAAITGTDGARTQLEGTLSNFVMIITGLLGLAVLVSLVGIANMMSLSVIERSRESALLRALGLSRRRLGRTLTVEALVLGAVGACTGVLLGVSFRSEEHTSELQSRENLVCRLLLEKKNVAGAR